MVKSTREQAETAQAERTQCPGCGLPTMVMVAGWFICDAPECGYEHQITQG